MLKYPDAQMISLGIGDSTEPIPEVITSAMAKVQLLMLILISDVIRSLVLYVMQLLKFFLESILFVLFKLLLRLYITYIISNAFFILVLSSSDI